MVILASNSCFSLQSHSQETIWSHSFYVVFLHLEFFLWNKIEDLLWLLCPNKSINNIRRMCVAQNKYKKENSLLYSTTNCISFVQAQVSL